MGTVHVLKLLKEEVAWATDTKLWRQNENPNGLENRLANGLTQLY